jgi:osmotically-inducible protein OsmY
MKNDSDLQRNVQNAIEWEPLLHVAKIWVMVNDRVVSLTGTVDSYAKKVEAENATKKVLGVKAIVQDIEVKIPGSWTRSDTEIVNDVLTALKSNWSIANDKINVKVEDGWVTLEGDLAWYYQKEAAKNVACFLKGIRGITNDIKICPKTQDPIDQLDIQNAIDRSWIFDNSDIQVDVCENAVTLFGTIPSLYQKDMASLIAWNSPGIHDVDNQLEVVYYYELV